MIIEINNIKDIQNTFNHEELSQDFINYLINKCKFNYDNTFQITVQGNLTEKDKKRLEKMIHNYFSTLYLRWNNFDKYDNYFRILLLILGIILILISEQLLSVFRELFLIAGWVVVWEIVYDELFSQIKRKREKKIYKMLSACKIEFMSEK